jgi:transcriptional regulator with XRE-family HTH domain
MAPLTEARTAAGLSQRALAEKAVVSPAAIGHLERGTRNPSRPMRRRLAAALGVPEEELFPSATAPPKS